MPKFHHRPLLAAVGAVIALGSVLVSATPAVALPAVSGGGSSFAGIEFQAWTAAVGQPPYNLNVNYISSSSGQGRSDFANQTVDFAVSDIRYDSEDDTVIPPASSFIYVPVTAGGVAFMYNLKAQGFTTSNPIKLSSLTICGIFTNAIPYWDDPSIKADNPGVNLPHIRILPVVRNDPAGTNFVLEEYCIATQPALYAQWATAASAQSGSDVPDAPTSTWPIIPPMEGATGSDLVADTVANPNDDGSITFVETGYAEQRGYPVASVKNDTGAYVQPSDTAVATALSYATQEPDGTHLLNFSPGDPAAYNPSTYSYLLLNIGSAANAAKGQTLTEFADYCLTIGQQQADSLGYASIGRSLIMFGLNRLQVVPGDVGPTQAELNAVPAVQQVVAHATTLSPTGVPTTPSKVATTSSSTKAASSSTGTNSSAVDTRSTGAASAGTGAATLVGADPAVSLSALTGPLGKTGVDTAILLGLGGALLLAGEAWRRAARRSRRARS